MSNPLKSESKQVKHDPIFYSLKSKAISIPVKVLRENIPPNAKLIYGIILRESENRVCFKDLDMLTKEIPIYIESVYRLLVILEEKRLIRVSLLRKNYSSGFIRKIEIL